MKLLLWFPIWYLLVFLALWLGGGYILTESGRVRAFMDIPTLTAAPDSAEWQPLIGHFQAKYYWPDKKISPRCDLIGWAYFPLLSLVARQHPPVPLLDDRGWPLPDPLLPKNCRLHPLKGQELARVTLNRFR